MAKFDEMVICDAILAYRKMDDPTKLALADEIFLKQPNLLMTALTPNILGVQAHKIDFLLDLLFIIYIAMENSEYDWPCISVSEFNVNESRIVAMAKFSEGLSAELKAIAAVQFTGAHPEPMLLAYVFSEVNDWIKKNGLVEPDTHLVLAAVNMANSVSGAKATKRPILTTERSKASDI